MEKGKIWFLGGSWDWTTTRAFWLLIPSNAFPLFYFFPSSVWMAQCRVELCHHTIVLTYALCETHLHWFTPQILIISHSHQERVKWDNNIGLIHNVNWSKMERLSDNIVFMWSLILSNVHHHVLLWTRDSIFFKLFVNISYWNNLQEFCLCCLRNLMGCNFPLPRGRVCCLLIGPHRAGQFHIRSCYTYVTSSVVIPRKALWSGHYSLWHLSLHSCFPNVMLLPFPYTNLIKVKHGLLYATVCWPCKTLLINTPQIQKNDKD